jgi:hypothetical protein
VTPLLLQLQIHLPAPLSVTVEAVPALHKPMVGALFKVRPFDDPHLGVVGLEPEQTAGPAFDVDVIGDP